MATDYKFRITAKDQTKGAFNSVNKSVNSTQAAMKKLAGAFAGVFAVRQIVMFGNEALALADTIGKVADSIGVSTEFLQKYQFAAQQSGLATEEFNKGMQNFTKMVGQAQLRTTEAGRTLEKLGVQVKNTDGTVKSAEEVFVELFEALDGVGSQFEKNAILADLMGRAGVKLAVMGKDGAEAMKELAESATGVMPEETIRQAERFNDTMNRLKREILTPLQARIIDVANSFLDFLDAMGLISAETKTLTLLTYDLEKAQLRLQKVQEQLESGTLGQGQRAAKQRQANLQKEIDDLNKLIATKKKEQEEEENRRKKYTATFTEIEDASANVTKTITDNITVVKQFNDTIEGQLTNAFTDFFDFANKEFMDFKNLATNVARAVINELIQIFVVKRLVGMVQGSITGFVESLDTSTSQALQYGDPSGALQNLSGSATQIQTASPTVNFNISTVDAAGFDQLLTSRKGTITTIINDAMNTQGKMGII